MNEPPIHISTSGGVTVAALSVELDISNAGGLGDRLVRAVPSGTTGLVLDLTDVGYADSSGVRMIFNVARRLRERRQKLAVVVGERSPLRTLVRLTNVETAASICATSEAAVDLLSAGS